jgi:hypothetical protein
MDEQWNERAEHLLNVTSQLGKTGGRTCFCAEQPRLQPKLVGQRETILIEGRLHVE